jgi:probable O-glycosylation ligase (exosortase A-associated)
MKNLGGTAYPVPTSTVLTNRAQPVVPAISAKIGTSLPFNLLLLYLLFEFGRPQDAVPGLAVLKPSMIVVVLLGVQLVKSKALKFTDTATKLFGVLLIFMIFHIPFAVNNYWAFHTFRAMAMTLIAYLGILTYVNTAERFKKLISVWLAIHSYLAISGLLHNGRGIGGWLGDENDFCLALNMVIPYAFFLASSDNNPKNKFLRFGMVGLFLSSIMATFSRGGFVGLIAVGLCCWFRSSKKIVSGCLIVIFAVLIMNFAPEGYWEEMSTIQKEYTGEMVGTGATRQYTWEVGWRMFLANPVFGVGQGNFPWEFGHYEAGDFEGRSFAGRAAHSLYYTLMPELGLLGIFLFVGMNYCIYKDLTFVRRLYKKKPKRAENGEIRFFFYSACALEASLVAFLASGYFISVLYYPSFWILMGFAVALRKVALADEKKSLTAH